jgi:hypothetical protein
LLIKINNKTTWLFILWCMCVCTIYNGPDLYNGPLLSVCLKSIMSNKKKTTKKTQNFSFFFGHRTYNLFLTSSYLKMASRNKLLPVWGSHCWNSCWGLHVSGKGILSYHGKKKSKDFQSCLPILPAYLPLKFPNGQFPMKIPGPISSTTLKKNKKKKYFFFFFFFTRGGVYTWVGKGYFFERAKNLTISNFVCQTYLHIFPWNFLTDNFPWKYQDLLARQSWNQRKKIRP